MLVIEYVDKKEFARLQKIVKVKPWINHEFPVTKNLILPIGKNLVIKIIYELPNQ
jgi:hypothetical protein